MWVKRKRIYQLYECCREQQVAAYRDTAFLCLG